LATTDNWENFWKEWRTKTVETEEDLYFQVGKTINKKPIEKEIFNGLTRKITNLLRLTSSDILVELCCGNGLSTYELKDYVKKIIAVDFSPHLIETAIKYKSADNISYVLMGVFDFLEHYEWDVLPSKFLMNDSLAYFNPEDLKKMLSYISDLSKGDFIFLLTGAPNDDLKYKFYNTDERRQMYLENIANGDTTNSGLGRWWKPEEIKEIISLAGLNCTIQNQPIDVSNYRMDIIITNK
jgi:SAM-dependent methyltransferase